MSHVARMATDTVSTATVVGAGPAGALAAALLARRGVDVTLVDKAAFPRAKVCGCCLSPTAMAALRKAGFDGLVERLGAVPLREMHLYNGAQRIVLEIADSWSLSRSAFDNALVKAAIAAGARFLPDTNATIQLVEGYSRVLEALGAVRDADHPDGAKRLEYELRSKVVIAADGLSGSSLRQLRHLQPHVESNSKVGIGAVLSAGACDFYEPNIIYMVAGAGGYIGLVRLEDNTLDVAAATDAAFLKLHGTPADAASALLRAARLPIPSEFTHADWRGTVALSRRRDHVAAERLFVIGDSASYVEPFTGEGIAWALLGAIHVAPLAERASLVWNPSLETEWEQIYNTEIRSRQRKTALVAGILKNDVLRNVGAEVLARVPMLSSFIVESIHA